MNNIRVLNKKNSTAKYDGFFVYIGRPSILGNPFSHIKTGTLAKYVVANREEAVKKYKEYFYEKMETDSKFRNRLDELEKLLKSGDLNLTCHCAPKMCHGDIVKEYLENKQGNGA